MYGPVNAHLLPCHRLGKSLKMQLKIIFTTGHVAHLRAHTVIRELHAGSSSCNRITWTVWARNPSACPPNGTRIWLPAPRAVGMARDLADAPHSGCVMEPGEVFLLARSFWERCF